MATIFSVFDPHEDLTSPHLHGQLTRHHHHRHGRLSTPVCSHCISNGNCTSPAAPIRRSPTAIDTTSERSTVRFDMMDSFYGSVYGSAAPSKKSSIPSPSMPDLQTDFVRDFVLDGQRRKLYGSLSYKQDHEYLACAGTSASFHIYDEDGQAVEMGDVEGVTVFKTRMMGDSVEAELGRQELLVPPDGYNPARLTMHRKYGDPMSDLEKTMQIIFDQEVKVKEDNIKARASLLGESDRLHFIMEFKLEPDFRGKKGWSQRMMLAYIEALELLSDEHRFQGPILLTPAPIGHAESWVGAKFGIMQSYDKMDFKTCYTGDLNPGSISIMVRKPLPVDHRRLTRLLEDGEEGSSPDQEEDMDIDSEASSATVVPASASNNRARKASPARSNWRKDSRMDSVISNRTIRPEYPRPTGPQSGPIASWIDAVDIDGDAFMAGSEAPSSVVSLESVAAYSSVSQQGQSVWSAKLNIRPASQAPAAQNNNPRRATAALAANTAEMTTQQQAAAPRRSTRGRRKPVATREVEELSYGEGGHVEHEKALGTYIWRDNQKYAITRSTTREDLAQAREIVWYDNVSYSDDASEANNEADSEAASEVTLVEDDATTLTELLRSPGEKRTAKFKKIRRIVGETERNGGEYIVEWAGTNPETGLPWANTPVWVGDVTEAAEREWEEVKERERDKKSPPRWK